MRKIPVTVQGWLVLVLAVVAITYIVYHVAPLKSIVTGTKPATGA